MPLSNNTTKDQQDPEKIAEMRKEVLKAVEEAERKERLEKEAKKKKIKQEASAEAKAAPVVKPVKEIKVAEKDIVKPEKIAEEKKAAPKPIPPKMSPLKKGVKEIKAKIETAKKQAKEKVALLKKVKQAPDKKQKAEKTKLLSTRVGLIRFGAKKTKDKRMEPYCEISSRPVKQTNVWRYFWVGVLAANLIVLIITAAVFYVPKSENIIARKISQVIPLPAIIIEGKFISYNQYLQEVDLVESALNKQKSGGIIREIPSRSEIKKNIKNHLIDQEIIKKLARQNNITVSQQEIKTQIDQIKKQTRSEDSIEKILQEMYGWSQQDFEIRVLQPYLTKLKLAKKLFPNITDEAELKQALNQKIEEEKQKMKIYILVND